MNESTLNRMIREHKEHLIWLSVFLVLAVFVTALVFGTLKRSVQAQTYTKRVFACSYAQEGAEPVAHKHNDDCYENGELICTLPERELHIHGDECYAEEKVLVCTLEEGEGHVHTDACYTEEPVLVCTMEESDGHVHSVENGCYTRVQGDLICTDEDPEHVHTDDCYTWEEVLTCEIPEGEGAHHHSEECYETQLVLSCGKEEGEGAHTHDDTCYEIQKVLICDKEEVKTEHVHTVDCFQVVDMSPEEIHALHLSELPESDPDADVESPDVWESRFASVPLSGHWDRDLLKIAETQLGYTESQRNFDAVLNEDGEGYTLKGWTRYGAWYGIPYGDWCAMFISFCLNYADIPESAVPYDCATTTWIDSLSARGMYAPAGSYDPKPGDLIFFDWEGDGLSDHVGIVWAVNPESITTIEGNHTTSVELFDYSPSDSHIQGYGILPENPELAAAATQDTEPADDASTGTDVENVENNNEETDADVTGDAVDAADSEAVNAADAAGTTAEGSANAEPAVNMPPFSYSERVAGMRVSIDADEGAFPEGTTVKITAIEDDGIAEQVAPAVSGQVVKVQAVDITFYDADGNEIEPQIPIRVTMRPFNEPEADKVGVVHVDNDGVVSAVETQNDVAQPDQGIAFSADSFSTYALVYTVTFAYDGEGNVYQYSMPGGTGLSLRELLIDLGMKTEDNVDSYLSHVVNVDFSKPDCMTLTKEENDWLLQSVHAFDTAESLTVTFDDYSMLAIPVTVSGIEELQLENASISSADGVFLPEGTEGYANVVEDTAETISAVEDYVEKNTPEPTLLQQLFSSNSKAEENNDKAYQVFDIGLDNVDTGSFKDGFNVEVKLPENVVGKDFHLYHIHDGNVEEIDLKLASTKMETGSDLVTGFSFQTDSFSTFALSYTVDFHYHGVVYSIPGNTQILLTQLIEIMHITMPDNAEAPENAENFDNAEAPENAENLDNAEAPENTENLDSSKASENEALLDVHDVASVEFTDTHLVQVDQVSGLLTINGVDGKLIDVDAGDYNFLLSSLEPFSTEEKLTITLKDGNVIEVGVTDDQLITVKISFESDGTTPATADMSPYKYLMSGNGNGTPTKVNKLVSWQCSGNIATASVAIRPGSSNPWSPKDELYLVTYTDDGELTREHASDTWYNDLQNGWTKIELGDSFELPHYMVTKTKEEGNELQYTAVKKEANDDRMTDYSLETLLEHYNIITLCPNTDSGHEYNGVTWGDGDFVYNQHTVGGILVRGDLIIKVANSIGGGNQATQPSAVGGAVIFDCGTIVQLIGGGIGYNDRHNPFYVGEVNCIVDGKFYYSGGLWNINTYGPTIANNDYVDWDALQASIIRHSRAMENSSTRTVTITNEGKQTINVQAGEKIKVVYGPGVDPEKTYITVKLDLMGQQFDTLPGTVISFAGGGNQYIPKLETINGETLPDSCDNGDGISVIYNFPEASALTNWDGNPEYGHVIAPFADVVLPGSNYNGCVIANSCYSGSEGHLSPYKGGTIIGFYGKLKTDKTVDNKEPTDRQVFKFVMQHLRNVVSESEYLEERGNGKTQNEIMWDYIGATMNNHSLVEFDKVPFYEAGTYYFLVYESTDKQYPDITLDPVKYIVEADVVANTIGENVILSIDSSSLKYYKVTDEANLITVNQDTTTGEYRATINEAAITLLGDLTWDNSTSTLNTPIEFQNKEKKSGITIRKVVTGTDDPTAEFPFKLYVWYEDEDTVNGKTSYIAYDGSVNANDEIKSFESSTYKLNSEDEGHTAGCVQFNLTTARPITFVGLPVGAHYAFVEDVSNLPTGYTFYSKTNDTGVVPETGTPSATVEFTNSYIYTYLDVEKKWSVDGVMTDDPGDGINEISFYLYRKTDSVEEIIDSETKEGKTDKYDAQHPEGAHPFTITKTQKPDSSSYEWKLHIDGLKKTDDNGNDYTYWITEDQVDGYSVAITMVKDDETVNVGPGTGCEQAPAESTITITNSKYSISLPETGGSGTTLYTLLGGLMVVAAGAVLTLRKKKNKA